MWNLCYSSRDFAVSVPSYFHFQVLIFCAYCISEFPTLTPLSELVQITSIPMMTSLQSQVDNWTELLTIAAMAWLHIWSVGLDTAKSLRTWHQCLKILFYKCINTSFTKVHFCGCETYSWTKWHNTKRLTTKQQKAQATILCLGFAQLKLLFSEIHVTYVLSSKYRGT